ncbi:HAD family hydrolase [Oceanimonas baumannii]|uniref:HAD family hydrolase n=1 Tax=Oceanimonas baumannii TaxID=129578 RepID=A0A235CH58_9GAMM|nr:HAD-IA family hydrolase [Oceanimonas baumannii]OYD23938.1 HAD family hydrolase [Oceanimonas baumannii]TDW58730.1 phosphoglycolate phosphatase [Oceanimonas baumannii]
MKYELVIFDWDGTLMDSVARIVSCMQAAAIDCNQPVPAPESVRHIIGLSLYRAFPILFGELSPAESDALLHAYRRHYLELNTTPTPLFTGAADMLSSLHGTGYRLAVATGKAREGLDRVLEETGLGHLFHALRGADQARSKPDPLMLVQILDELGLAPEQAVMVGDSSYDLAMAEAIGMDRIGVTYGVHNRDQLTVHSPVAMIDDIRHLRDWV